MSFLSGHSFVNSDEKHQIILDGGDERSIDVETRSNYGEVCNGGKMCVPMSECAAIYYEVAKSCYNGDRSLYCGGSQYEPYVCCPKSPIERNSVCGKTLVSGQFYRGLGAFPFVARIGFKSKFKPFFMICAVHDLEISSFFLFLKLIFLQKISLRSDFIQSRKVCPIFNKFCHELSPKTINVENKLE